MKKIIILIISFHASLLTLHEIWSQTISDPIISGSVAFFEPKPIREMTIVLPGEREKEQRIALNMFSFGSEEISKTSIPADKPVLQKTHGHSHAKGPMLNFEGVGNVNATYPADPNGDVGLNHYVQTVNDAFAVWDKDGNLVYGPVDNMTLFESFPGPWNDYYWSDPVFKYDQLGDRWVISSMAYNFINFYTMIAVSTTPDPLGSYYCYAYYFADMNDYPKLSVWPDGYYVTYNFWDYSSDIFLHTLYSVVDRDAMLNGEPVANMIQFQAQDLGEWLLFPLPSDLRGNTVPVDTPIYFVKLARHESGNPWHLWLDVHAFDTDWDVPSNSTLEQIAQFDMGQFEPLPVPYGPGSPQLGSDINVMTLPLILMYPLTYRMFSDHESMVCCHTVYDVDVHYIKWYELRNEGAGWYIYQVDFGQNRWGDYSSIFWTTSGDGNFISNYKENATYLRGPGDLQNEQVTLTMNLTGYLTGSGAADSMLLYLSKDPQVNAGNNLIVYEDEPVAMQGEVLYAYEHSWSTTGDGTFNDSTLLDAIYSPGPGDVASQQVTLILTAYEVSTCTGSVADSLVVTILAVGTGEEQDDMEFTLSAFRPGIW